MMNANGYVWNYRGKKVTFRLGIGVTKELLNLGIALTTKEGLQEILADEDKLLILLDFVLKPVEPNDQQRQTLIQGFGGDHDDAEGFVELIKDAIYCSLLPEKERLKIQEAEKKIQEKQMERLEKLLEKEVEQKLKELEIFGEE